MKASHWTERRRAYLASKQRSRKGRPVSNVINISEGFLARRVQARITVDQILDGVRCSGKFLAERLEPRSRGKKGALAENEPTGAQEAPVQIALGFPAPGGDAA